MAGGIVLRSRLGCRRARVSWLTGTLGSGACGTDAQCGDLIARLAQDLEAVAVEVEHLARLGDGLRLMNDEACNSRRLLVRQVPVHLPVQVSDGDGAVDI